MLAYIIKASLNNNVNKKPEVNTLINSLIMKLKNKIISYCFLILTILLCHLDKSQLHKTHFYSEAQKFIPVKEAIQKSIFWKLTGSWENNGLFYVTEASFYDNGEKGYTRLEHFNSEGNFENKNIYINNYNFYTPKIEPREVSKQLYYYLEKDFDLHLDANRRYYKSIEVYSLKKGCSVEDKIWIKINDLLDQDILRRIDYSQKVGNLAKSNWCVNKLRTQSISVLSRDNIYTNYYNRQVESPNNSNFSKSKLCPGSNNLLSQDNIYQKYYSDRIESSSNSNRSKSKLCRQCNNLISQDNIYQEYYIDSIGELQNLNRPSKSKIKAYCKKWINTHLIYPDYSCQDYCQPIITYPIQKKRGNINNSDTQNWCTCLHSNFKEPELNLQILQNSLLYFQAALNISRNRLSPYFTRLTFPTCINEPQAEKAYSLRRSHRTESSIEYQIS